MATRVLCIAVAIRGLLFDFDGLILDTESASYAGWQWIYGRHGHELDLELWSGAVGTVAGFDPMAHLEELLGRKLDWKTLNEQRAAHELSLLEAEELRPGIVDYLADSERLGLARAIVSSASRDWIDLHLARFERTLGWGAIVTADHDPGRAKPRPTLYLEALDLLGLEAAEAVAFEDSPNGVRAAKGAGVFTVAVPNAITRNYGLEGADLVLGSLADVPLEALLEQANERRNGGRDDDHDEERRT
jgi:HAD superfamily hydrolase (TIGR01509 family)